MVRHIVERLRKLVNSVAVSCQRRLRTRLLMLLLLSGALTRGLIVMQMRPLVDHRSVPMAHHARNGVVSRRATLHGAASHRPRCTLCCCTSVAGSSTLVGAVTPASAPAAALRALTRGASVASTELRYVCTRRIGGFVRAQAGETSGGGGRCVRGRECALVCARARARVRQDQPVLPHMFAW